VRVEIRGEINNSWNAQRDADTGSVIFRNNEDNRILFAQQQAQFGFCAAR